MVFGVRAWARTGRSSLPGHASWCPSDPMGFYISTFRRSSRRPDPDPHRLRAHHRVRLRRSSDGKGGRS
eukprot:11967979-Heterocapsa_arctica.AAC.1